MQTITICLINQKGGCGKSSNCFHLAGAFAQAGYRVLLVDADPQGSLSQGFFGSALIEGLAAEATVAALFDEDLYFHGTSQLIRTTECAGIFVCPANQHLAKFNTPSPETPPRGTASANAADTFGESITGYRIA